MTDDSVDLRVRAEEAKTLMPFMHPKAGEGVKAGKQAAANKAATGRFGVALPPLRVVT
jgi:phage terminase small subunit